MEEPTNPHIDVLRIPIITDPKKNNESSDEKVKRINIVGIEMYRSIINSMVSFGKYSNLKIELTTKFLTETPLFKMDSAENIILKNNIINMDKNIMKNNSTNIQSYHNIVGDQLIKAFSEEVKYEDTDELKHINTQLQADTFVNKQLSTVDIKDIGYIFDLASSTSNFNCKLLIPNNINIRELIDKYIDIVNIKNHYLYIAEDEPDSSIIDSYTNTGKDLIVGIYNNNVLSTDDKLCVLIHTEHGFEIHEMKSDTEKLGLNSNDIKLEIDNMIKSKGGNANGDDDSHDDKLEIDDYSKVSTNVRILEPVDNIIDKPTFSPFLIFSLLAGAVATGSAIIITS